ncbi:E3 ubiquitin-protein ligase BRE1-like 1 [Vitis vinifera]|uniref:E3 ubiquitin protein ligase n=1 Tax=Vitis vinifera TaxID=29760 RepID=A0A438CA59_VITVI|nr:E3 ubiquitin-protein ligase BRE1-like 1 [Vitis vinifera]
MESLGSNKGVLCGKVRKNLSSKFSFTGPRQEFYGTFLIWDVLEARDKEYKAWAHVQSLKSSLNEHSLELRVKTAIEAEALSQQRLAAAEAVIVDLRQKLEASKSWEAQLLFQQGSSGIHGLHVRQQFFDSCGFPCLGFLGAMVRETLLGKNSERFLIYLHFRDMFRLSDVLKSKHEENEAYLSEIETIGQAYDDMQTQNQHLLQQITERDDYNIKVVSLSCLPFLSGTCIFALKTSTSIPQWLMVVVWGMGGLVLEGVRSRQLQDSLLMEKQTMERGFQRATTSLGFFDMKAGRIEDQLKMCSDQVQKLAEDRLQSLGTLANFQKRLLDVTRLSQQARESLEESQSKVDKSRVSLGELQIELEKERFEKKRTEEELEVVRRKASRLRAQTEGSSIVDKLRQELREYRDILKCGICHERPKEVSPTYYFYVMG